MAAVSTNVPVHPALVDHVQGVRVFENLVPGAWRIQAFPDGSTGMLLWILGNGGGDLSVAGPRTRALFKTAPPAEFAIFIAFKPGGGVPFVGVDASEIRDRIVRIDQVWGHEGACLRDRLLDTRVRSETLEVLQRSLRDRLCSTQRTAATEVVRRAVVRLGAADAKVRIEDLATELGVSTRHLRRVFTARVGVGPKEFARMARLQRALVGARRGDPWTELAQAAGYYDQAHFIAEFRELVGTTPSRFAKAHHEPPLHETASRTPVDGIANRVARLGS